MLSFFIYAVQHQIKIYTLQISRCIAAARERIPGSIDNYVTGVTGVSECSQQRGNLKDNGYINQCYPNHPVMLQHLDFPWLSVYRRLP
ncbi:hypothetical protein [Photorhabdus sp. RW14-46]|uniref:hypothetical protein n=1 Tax=Photorhabdus sp. RW14-46 TaxID=2100168 RepID=UPI0013F497D4|nr:hypothetical protein [Photorhabdus sp. RW14-46]